MRTLSWKRADGTAIRVFDMSDDELMAVRQRMVSQLAVFKLQTGENSLSQLTLDYLDEEVAERGLDHDSFY